MPLIPNKPSYNRLFFFLYSSSEPFGLQWEGHGRQTKAYSTNFQWTSDFRAWKNLRTNQILGRAREDATGIFPWNDRKSSQSLVPKPKNKMAQTPRGRNGHEKAERHQWGTRNWNVPNWWCRWKTQKPLAWWRQILIWRKQDCRLKRSFVKYFLRVGCSDVSGHDCDSLQCGQSLFQSSKRGSAVVIATPFTTISIVGLTKRDTKKHKRCIR